MAGHSAQIRIDRRCLFRPTAFAENQTSIEVRAIEAAQFLDRDSPVVELPELSPFANRTTPERFRALYVVIPSNGMARPQVEELFHATARQSTRRTLLASISTEMDYSNLWQAEHVSKFG